MVFKGAPPGRKSTDSFLKIGATVRRALRHDSAFKVDLDSPELLRDRYVGRGGDVGIAEWPDFVVAIKKPLPMRMPLVFKGSLPLQFDCSPPVPS